MKVLLIIDSLSLGGAERVLATLAHAGRGVGLDFDALVLSEAADGRTQMLRTLRDAGLAPQFAGVRALRDPLAVPRLARWIRASGCDVVHSHLEYSTVLGTVAAKAMGVPAVSTLHHMPEQLPVRERAKEALAVAIGGRGDALIFVSHAARSAFATRYRPRPSWQVLHNGIDLSSFYPGEEVPPPQLALEPDALVVTMVAAMRGRKGHDLMLDSWSQVVRGASTACLVLVGSGPEESALRQRARNLGIQDSVRFVGQSQDVASILRASSVVVLPSETEALPTVLIEAGGCGVPAVATDVGGVADVIEDGITGLLLPIGDGRQLVAHLLRLLDDSVLRMTMGAAARARVEQRFDMHRWAEQLKQVYAGAADR